MNKYSNNIQGIKTIEELRAFHNERVIHLTYIVMLGRQADDGTLKHLINELECNDGFTIEKMQEDLRNSDEYQLYKKSKTNQPSKIIMYLTQANMALEKLTPQGRNVYFQLEGYMHRLEG